jgi:hypothetical protein
MDVLTKSATTSPAMRMLIVLNIVFVSNVVCECIMPTSGQIVRRFTGTIERFIKAAFTD